jgi:hypothetical protein
MNTHEAGRAKAAWRERNAGEEAPGDGQNVSNYVEYGTPEPGTVGLVSTDDHVDQPAKGLSTKNSPGLLGRARKT